MLINYPVKVIMMVQMVNPYSEYMFLPAKMYYILSSRAEKV